MKTTYEDCFYDRENDIIVREDDLKEYFKMLLEEDRTTSDINECILEGIDMADLKAAIEESDLEYLINLAVWNAEDIFDQTSLFVVEHEKHNFYLDIEGMSLFEDNKKVAEGEKGINNFLSKFNGEYTLQILK